MMDWVTQGASTITTYGRNRKVHAAPQASQYSFGSNENKVNALGSVSSDVKIFDFDSIFTKEEESTSSKRLKQEGSSKGLKDQPIEPKSAFTKLTKTTKKKENEMREAIKKGHHEDIDFLIKSIDIHNAGLSVHSSLNFLVTEAAFESRHRSRVTTWLESIGFKENTFRTFYLPISELDLLFRLLKDYQRTYTSSQPPTPLGSNSGSSEFLSQHGDAPHDSFLTKEKLEDCDRRTKAAKKASVQRKRSISNPTCLQIHTTLLEANIPPAPLTATLRSRSSSNTLTMLNPLNLTINTARFPRRRSSQDSDDSSDRGGESPAFLDNFSPISGQRSRSNSCRAARNRSVSPLEPSLMDSMQNQMSFGNDEDGDGPASTGSGPNSVSAPLGGSHAQSPLPCFSKKRDPAVGLQCILEESAELANDLTFVEEDDKAAGLDSDTSTQVDIEEEGPRDDNEEGEGMSSAAQEDALNASHISGIAEDLSSPRQGAEGSLLDRSHSFFSPPTSGHSQLLVPSFEGRPSFPLADHAGVSNSRSSTVSFAKSKSTSLFGAAVGGSAGLFSGADHAYSPSDDLASFRRSSAGIADAPPPPSYLAASNKQSKKMLEKKNKLNRSQTAPMCSSYAFKPSESTPVADHRDCYSQPNPHLFNTPQAVFRERWEVSKPADWSCIQFLSRKMLEVEVAASSGSGSKVHSSPHYEQLPHSSGEVIGGGAAAAAAHFPSEMTCLAHAAKHVSIFGSGAPRGQGLDLFDAAATRRALPDDIFSDCGMTMAGHDHMGSLVSGRPSIGVDEHYSAARAQPPLEGGLHCDAIQNARLSANSLFRRVMSSSASLASMSTAPIDTTSPLHHVVGDSSRPAQQLFAAAAPEYAPSVSAADAERTQQLKRLKSRSKLRRQSVSVSRGAASRASLLNVSTVSRDQRANEDSLAAGMTELSISDAFSPCVKSKNATSSRSRRRRMSAQLSATKSSAVACAILPRFNEEDDEEDNSASGSPYKVQRYRGDSDLSLNDSMFVGPLGALNASTRSSHEEQQQQQHHKQQLFAGWGGEEEDHELGFEGLVLGGSYQHCFEDGGVPVVSAPGSSDSRISDLRLHRDNHLVLTMYSPKGGAASSIDLGRDWRWRRASPCGYLVCAADNAQSPVKPVIRTRRRAMAASAPSVVYYFLPKHPEAWVTSSLAKSSRPQPADADSPGPHFMALDDAEDPCAGDFFDASGAHGHDRSFMDMDCDEVPARVGGQLLSAGSTRGLRQSELRELSKGLYSADSSQSLVHFGGEGSALTEDEAEMDLGQGDEDEDEDFCPLTQVTQLDECDIDAIETDCSFTVVTPAETFSQGRASSSSEHCLNAGIMSLVFGYLLDPSASGGRSSPANGKPARKNGRGGRSNSRSPNTTPAWMSAGDLQSVCKAWALAGYMVAAQRVSDLDAGTARMLTYEGWSRFVGKYSWGKFLSRGVAKSVYCVQNCDDASFARQPQPPRLEAVSIMDVTDLCERDMLGAVTQELQISVLCSAMVSPLCVCPNLVQVHSMFQAEYAQPPAMWDEPRPRPLAPAQCTVPVPRKGEMEAEGRGNFQFIRMEFCAGGDLEELVRKAGQLSAAKTRQTLFQMCFALYSCREQLALRHFDIKLLNFFMTTGAAALPENNQSCDARHDVGMDVGFGAHRYRLSLGAAAMDLVKLADFGTSAVGNRGLGDPITVQQFTTLENTPPEFLIMGSRARQSFSADTFALGLCFLHLLTGHEPYEELLKEVRCPRYLSQRLKKVWLTDDEESPYFAVREVLDSLQAVAEENREDAQLEGRAHDAAEEELLTEVLYDTLYRFAVLFGLEVATFAEDNPVWAALTQSLLPGQRKSAARSGSRAADCLAQYQADCAMWSIRSGQHARMAGARERMSELGDGAPQLLESMAHFDPSLRCSMYEALHSPMFAGMRVQNSALGVARSGRKARTVVAVAADVSYMHYHRGVGEGGCDNLPIL